MNDDPVAELGRKAEELASCYMDAVRAFQECHTVDIEPLGDDDAKPDSMWAVDGSHTFLLGVGGRFLVWTRAVALFYEVDAGGAMMFKDIEVRQESVLLDQQAKTEGNDPGRKSLSERADYHRHHMELSLLNKVSQKSDSGLVALDGALSAPPSGELSDMLHDAAESCQNGGASLVGVSKDSSSQLLGADICDEDLLGVTRHPESGFVRLPGLAERRRPPVLGESCFARLHPSAVKWFRVDVASRQPPGTVLGRLARFSTSYASPGYPMPLIEAHRAAVLVRQMQPQLRELALKAAARAGIPAEQLALSLTDAEGRRAGEYHVLLDELARTRK